MGMTTLLKEYNCDSVYCKNRYNYVVNLFNSLNIKIEYYTREWDDCHCYDNCSCDPDRHSFLGTVGNYVLCVMFMESVSIKRERYFITVYNKITKDNLEYHWDLCGDEIIRFGIDKNTILSDELNKVKDKITKEIKEKECTISIINEVFK